MSEFVVGLIWPGSLGQSDGISSDHQGNVFSHSEARQKLTSHGNWFLENLNMLKIYLSRCDGKLQTRHYRRRLIGLGSLLFTCFYLV